MSLSKSSPEPVAADAPLKIDSPDVGGVIRSRGTFVARGTAPADTVAVSAVVVRRSARPALRVTKTLVALTGRPGDPVKWTAACGRLPDGLYTLHVTAVSAEGATTTIHRNFTRDSHGELASLLQFFCTVVDPPGDVVITTDDWFSPSGDTSYDIEQIIIATDLNDESTYINPLDRMCEPYFFHFWLAVFAPLAVGEYTFFVKDTSGLSDTRKVTVVQA